MNIFQTKLFGKQKKKLHANQVKALQDIEFNEKISQKGGKIMMDSTENTGWKNSDNVDFYENVPVELLQEFVTMGGLHDNCDLELIYPIIQNAPSIVEIGAGYGRIIKFLLEKDYQGSITAIERSKNLYDYLSDMYEKKINLIHADIETLNFKNKFGAVLFLWSGISEWPPEKQFAIIEKLFSWVSPGGYLILELFNPEQAPLNSTSCEQQFYEYKSTYGTAVGYTPNQDEMEKYLSSLNAQSINFTPYTTTKNRKRSLHFIQKR